MKTLHLILKRKWYDMIASGEKKEEYREITPYYIKRLCYGITYPDEVWKARYFSIFKDYDKVCFHFGYTRTTMTLKIDYMEIGQGYPGWGAEPGKQYFVIKLGERL